MASQFINKSDYFNVTFACGSDNFRERPDYRDLIEEWKNGSSSRAFYESKKELLSADISLDKNHFGLFDTDHCKYKVDRNPQEDPSLTD
jgi:alkaline phosphatase